MLFINVSNTNVVLRRLEGIKRLNILNRRFIIIVSFKLAF